MTPGRTLNRLGTIAFAFTGLSCGGPTVPVTPTPTPVPIPSVAPTPVVTAQCGNLAPGPVVRYAIAPRAARVNGENVPMRVWIQGPWQEAWCLDKDKEYQIDFNSNQRNADGKECCFVNDPEWQVSTTATTSSSDRAASASTASATAWASPPVGWRPPSACRPGSTA